MTLPVRTYKTLDRPLELPAIPFSLTGNLAFLRLSPAGSYPPPPRAPSSVAPPEYGILEGQVRGSLQGNWASVREGGARSVPRRFRTVPAHRGISATSSRPRTQRCPPSQRFPGRRNDPRRLPTASAGGGTSPPARCGSRPRSGSSRSSCRRRLDPSAAAGARPPRARGRPCAQQAGALACSLRVSGSSLCLLPLPRWKRQLELLLRREDRNKI